MSRLSEYLKGKREEQNLATADADQMRTEWLKRLDGLMRDIDDWLEPARQEGLRVTEASVEVRERMLGTYSAPKRAIEFAGRRIDVEPKARVIVGGSGRVDVSSSVGRAFLIYSKAEGGWVIVNDRDWTSREPLTQETFERLMEAFL